MAMTVQHRFLPLLGLGLCLLLLGASGCRSSMRDVYYSTRAIHHNAQAGDGSIVAIGSNALNSSSSATLTLIPITDIGELAMGDQ